MILNRQRQIPIPIAPLNAFLARVRRRLDLPRDSLTVCFVSDAEIARWNRAYRGKNGPTDVLSFPVGASPDSSERRQNGLAPGNAFRARPRSGEKARTESRVPSARYLGDIAISPESALRNARRFKRNFDEELRILILHGAIHLLGYDHETDNGEMERHEIALRRSLGLS